MSFSPEELDKNSVSSCVCLHGDSQWTCKYWIIESIPDWLKIQKKILSSLFCPVLSFIQYAVAVQWWWCCVKAFAHICFSTPSWPRLGPLWAGYLIINAVGGGGTEILFSAYLGIYCSTECNITIQKQDPNHTNPTIPLSFFSSSASPSVYLEFPLYHNSQKAPSLFLCDGTV